MNNPFKNAYYGFKRLRLRLKSEYTRQNRIIRKKYKEDFLALKDIHKGERCFVIGNGPSLTAADLSLLKDEYTFAANRIFYIFDKTEWRPTYFGAQDWAVIVDIMPHLTSISKQCKKMFLIGDCYKNAPEELTQNKDVLFFCAQYVAAHKERLFSDHIEQWVSGGGSITYACIQIAAYMGFSEIYLIGVDHNYSTAAFSNIQMGSSDVKANYFEGMPATLKVTKPNPDNATLSFMRAKEYGDAHDIKIINATRGGKLEVFPRMTLEEVLEKK